MIEGMHHNAIIVSDIDRSITFYRDILGLRLTSIATEALSPNLARSVGLTEEMEIRVAFFGDLNLELIEYVKPRGKSLDRTANIDFGEMHIAFRVSDIKKAYNELKKRGVIFSSPPIEITEGPMKGWKCAYIKDPDGAQLELVEDAKPPPVKVRWEDLPPPPEERFIEV